MSFGKRGAEVGPNPHQQRIERENTASPGDGGINTKSLVFGAVGLFLLVVVGKPLFSYIIAFALSGVSFDPYDLGGKDFTQFISSADRILAGPENEAELAIHRKCQAPIVKEFERSKASAEAIRQWPAYGIEHRVENVASYVSCTMSDTPARFCKLATRGRLVSMLNGYVLAQAEARSRALDDIALPPGFAESQANKMGWGKQKTDAFNPEQSLDPVLTAFDPKLLGGIKFLVQHGYVPAQALSEGKLGAIPAVNEILESAKDVKSACPSDGS